uniref:Uncharacterized protein n=1 Tax=Panagrolaimus sp. PS1159 TaxID=55785 RepID=A0AC35FC78_9BILA
MELLAVIILLSGFLSLSSAYKLAQKFPLEYQRIPQISSSDFGTILPYEIENRDLVGTFEAFRPLSAEYESTLDTIQPRKRRARNLRSLMYNLRGQIKPLCFFTAIPCRSIRQSSSI